MEKKMENYIIFTIILILKNHFIFSEKLFSEISDFIIFKKK